VYILFAGITTPGRIIQDSFQELHKWYILQQKLL